MTVRDADRRPPVPDAAGAGAGANWSWGPPVAALVLAGMRVLPAAVARGWVPACLFRKLTGWPCPTCRGTRSLMALASGDVGKAIALNPLVALAVLAVAGAGLVGVAERLARRPLLTGVASRLHRPPWRAVLGLLLANWAYVLLRR